MIVNATKFYSLTKKGKKMVKEILREERLPKK